MGQYNIDLRPETPAELIGYTAQEMANTIEVFENATCLLIVGATGTGKTTLAKAVLKHMGADVREANAGAETGVDKVRELIAIASRRTLSGKKRAFLIDEVHALSPQAMKALLIPTEAPDSSTIWVFCTNEPERLPPTLLRRCLKLTTPEWTPKRLERLAKRVSKKTGKPVPKDFKQFANPSDLLTFMQVPSAQVSGEAQKRTVATATYLLNILLGNGHDKRKINYDMKYSTIMEISLAIRGTLGAVLPYETPDATMMKILRASDPKIVARVANACAAALRDDTRPPMVLLDMLVGFCAAPYLFEPEQD